MSCLLWRVIATEINSLMNRQRKKVLRKHWPEQFLKHEQSYGICFFFLLNSTFQQIYSDHLLWKQIWITVKTCYTINFIFIFFCNFPTLILVAFGNIFCQLSKQAQKRSVPRISRITFCLLFWFIDTAWLRQCHSNRTFQLVRLKSVAKNKLCRKFALTNTRKYPADNV